MDVAIIIPVIDPKDRLVELADALVERGLSRIVVVDDGSSSEHAHIFDILSKLDIPEDDDEATDAE